MTAPFPTLTINVRQTAEQIVGHYGWMAILSNEIVNEPNLNVKKLAQLAYTHCRLFVSLTASPPSELITAVYRIFEQQGMSWATQAAMTTDLVAIRGEANTLFIYVRDNLQSPYSYAELTYDANGNEVEVATIVTPKPQAVHDRVAALRVLYT